MRHRWFTGATAAVTVGLLLLASSAHADPADDKSRVDRELAKAEAALEGATEKAQAAVRALQEVKEKLPGARDAVAEAQGVLAAARVAAREAGRKAEEAKGVYDAATVKLDESNKAVDQARDALGTSVTHAYEGLGAVTFASVLNANGPEEFVDRLTYMDKLAESQDTALDEVFQASFRAKEQQNVTLAAKRTADEAKTAADSAVTNAEGAAAEAAAYEQQLNELIRTRDDAVATADGEREETLARYHRLEAESERISRMLQSAASSSRGNEDSAPANSHGARFIMPVQGWKSSDFGWRYDPYYHVSQLHAGMDIAANGGAPIHAAGSGRVVQAGWNGGYGNYTCIYHGGGISTCYGHQSSIGVRVGQHVDTGDYIGAVGTTGASTGNHLHFEVRVNGNPVNPVGWLPGCLC